MNSKSGVIFLSDISFSFLSISFSISFLVFFSEGSLESLLSPSLTSVFFSEFLPFTSSSVFSLFFLSLSLFSLSLISFSLFSLRFNLSSSRAFFLSSSFLRLCSRCSSRFFFFSSPFSFMNSKSGVIFLSDISFSFLSISSKVCSTVFPVPSGAFSSISRNLR